MAEAESLTDLTERGSGAVEAPDEVLVADAGTMRSGLGLGEVVASRSRISEGPSVDCHVSTLGRRQRAFKRGVARGDVCKMFARGRFCRSGGLAVESPGTPKPLVAEADGNRTRPARLSAAPVLKTGGPTRRPDASAVKDSGRFFGQVWSLSAPRPPMSGLRGRLPLE